MIQFKTGNILAEDAEALVNTVNCVGIMGRGIALQFKNAFPENFKQYAAACAKGEVRPGRMFVFETLKLTNPRYIVNFPTKRHWRADSRIEDIKAGLTALADFIRNMKITSIAIPPLGSGLGGLDWATVRACIQAALQNLENCSIIVYEPQVDVKSSNVTRTSTVPNMTTGRAVLVKLMHRYIEGLLDPYITLLEVHKLMYFMQEAGQELKLKYSKAPYGPFATNLNHVLNAIEGHLVNGYADGGDSPAKQLELMPDSLDKAIDYLKDDVETQDRLDKVSDLVQGFETPFGLELLSTVHWVIKKQRAGSLDEVIKETYAWGERKKDFSARQITLARKVLIDKCWVTEQA